MGFDRRSPADERRGPVHEGLKLGGGTYEEIASLAYDPEHHDHVWFALGFGKGLYIYDRTAKTVDQLVLPPDPGSSLLLYLKALGDPRAVVSDPEARYFGGRVEERSLVPLGDARLGRIGLDEWLRRSQAKA